MKKTLLLAALSLALGACAQSGNGRLTLAEQGSFAVGGTVKTSEGRYDANPAALKGNNNDFWNVYQVSTQAGGQTLHGDHAAVFYQIPERARSLPLVFLHGYGGSMRVWQTTPDGREGFQNIFLRKRYPVYLVDQPRRGQAGRSSADGKIAATPDDQFWFAQFRIGSYPNFNQGVAFPQDQAALQQFFRTITPDTGPTDAAAITGSMGALFDKIGGGILVTHSAGGAFGWLIAGQNPNVKAVVAYEPGNFPFPEGEVPPLMENRFGNIAPMKTDADTFRRLTQIPIVIYFGDFIPDAPDGTQGGDQWYMRMKLAQDWVNTVNKHGGKATLVHLPKVGIKGNTHFPFSDLNNQEVAEHLAGWLKEKGLDK